MEITRRYLLKKRNVFIFNKTVTKLGAEIAQNTIHFGVKSIRICKIHVIPFANDIYNIYTLWSGKLLFYVGNIIVLVSKVVGILSFEHNLGTMRFEVSTWSCGCGGDGGGASRGGAAPCGGGGGGGAACRARSPGGTRRRRPARSHPWGPRARAACRARACLPPPRGAPPKPAGSTCSARSSTRKTRTPATPRCCSPEIRDAGIAYHRYVSCCG